MKKTLLVFQVLIISLNGFSQEEVRCSISTKSVEGILTNGSNASPIFKMTSSSTLNVGDKGELYKYFNRQTIFGNMKGTLGIADVKVVKVSGSSVYLKVLEEKSSIVINGKKKDHFVKGNKIKLNIFSYEKPMMTEEKWSNGNIKAKGLMACGSKSGVWSYFNEKGDLVEKYALVKEKKEGIYQDFHTNGNVKNEGLYDNDSRKGDWKSYHSTGELAGEVSYTFGKLRGPFKKYHKNGRIESEGKYGYDEKIDGDEIHFYSNGLKKSAYLEKDKSFKSWYINGQEKSIGKLDYNLKPVGAWKMYSSQGVLILDCLYKSGELFGAYFEFYDDGTKKYERKYGTSGRKEGTWNSYDKKGQLVSRMSYKADLLNGKKETFYENGQLKESATYLNGKLTGSYSLKSEEGKLKVSGTYNSLGKKHGNWLNYFESGEVKMQTPYDAGIVTGKMMLYSAPNVLKYKYDVIDGRNAGTYEKFFEDGEHQVLCQYDENGKMTGLYQEFNKKGKAIVKGKYVNGKKVGKWIEVDANGKKKRVKY